jgi:outer membrane lipoprotein-sorting protein
LFFLAIFFSTDLRAAPYPAEQAMTAVEKMKAAYAQVVEYQTEMEVREYRDREVVEKRCFLYTFKKPDHVRIDMQAPYSGMILVYPDKDGKVFVKPAGWMRFMKLHLSPDSSLLRSRTGQRLDQTDLGLLIGNIARSLADWRRGEIMVYGANDRLFIEVLAQDHFHPGMLTLYRFAVDTTLWLPVEVTEFTPEGVPKRRVLFRNLRTSISVPGSFFRIDEE